MLYVGSPPNLAESEVYHQQLLAFVLGAPSWTQTHQRKLEIMVIKQPIISKHCSLSFKRCCRTLSSTSPHSCLTSFITWLMPLFKVLELHCRDGICDGADMLGCGFDMLPGTFSALNKDGPAKRPREKNNYTDQRHLGSLCSCWVATSKSLRNVFFPQASRSNVNAAINRPKALTTRLICFNCLPRGKQMPSFDV